MFGKGSTWENACSSTIPSSPAADSLLGYLQFPVPSMEEGGVCSQGAGQSTGGSAWGRDLTFLSHWHKGLTGTSWSSSPREGRNKP